jgi:PKD repeat protein
LVATSLFGCKDSITSTVQVTLQPDSINPPIIGCPNDVLPVQLFATGGISYNWIPTNGLSNASIQNPIANPSTTTTYSVIITELDALGNTCTDTLSSLITLYPGIISNFSSAPNLCGNSIQFTDLSASSPITWDWNFGDGVTDTIQNPLHSYSAPGTYSVALVTTTLDGCKDSLNIPITVGGFNPIGINPTNTICFGNTVQLSASGGIAYLSLNYIQLILRKL